MNWYSFISADDTQPVTTKTTQANVIWNTFAQRLEAAFKYKF